MKISHLRSLVVAFIILVAFSFTTQQAYAFSGGSGTDGDPYQMTTCADFESMLSSPMASFIFENDIDCTADGNAVGFATIFGGHINGNGHKLTYALTTTGPSSSWALIEDFSGIIENLWVDGTVTDTYGSDVLSGLIYSMDSGTISNVKNTVTIVGGTGTGLVGGFASYMQGGTIEDSYFSGSIVTNGDTVGGLVGRMNAGTITNSYAAGTVEGVNNVGGLVGYLDSGTITNSFASPTMSGTTLGGLVGWYQSMVGGGVFSGDYWDITRTTQTTCNQQGDIISGCTGVNSGSSSPNYFTDNTNAPLSAWNTSTWTFSPGNSLPELTLFSSDSTSFITTWKTNNPGVSANNQITIPTFSGATYNYNVDWGDGETDTGVTGNITHTYATAGTYTVKISGTFPRIYFDDGGYTDAQKILSIEQWGNNPWTSFGNSFAGCINLILNATDTPDLSNVTDMGYMFLNATSLNTDIHTWDVSHVQSMYGTFQSATSFNQPLNSWNVSNVVNMGYMFENATHFNQDLSSWNTSNVTEMDSMFNQASNFNQDLSNWDVSHVVNMGAMFYAAYAFDNGGVALTWNTASAQYMNGMFNLSQFNQDISSWDVSHVTTFASMFNADHAFNQDISGWDVSHANDMNLMFYAANAFNQDLSSWDVSHVTDLSGMFYFATSFNQPLNSWNVSSATNMAYMFANASAFNQNLGNWNVSHVTNMDTMFGDASSFDQDISSWNISHVTNMLGMFTNVTLSTAHYDALLTSWSVESPESGVSFTAGNSLYCSSVEAARRILTTTYSWAITDGGVDGSCPTVSSGGSSGVVPVWILQSMSDQLRAAQTASQSTSAVPANPIPSTTDAFVFTKYLKLGMTDSQVKKLQAFLNAHGAQVSASGDGAPGHETTSFGKKTLKALALYQKANGIKPSSGYFGPVTMKLVNQLLSQEK